MKLNVMLDLETTATDYNAGVLSIGAVPFGCGEMLQPFYEKCSLLSLENNGFSISRKTMDWWEKQDSKVRAEAFSGTQPIGDMLEHFGSYLRLLPGEVVIWGNGADFDNAILSNAYDVSEMVLPWRYHNNRCFRTLKNTFGPETVAIPPFVGDKHNALMDAMFQAKHAERIFAYIELAHEALMRNKV